MPAVSTADFEPIATQLEKEALEAESTCIRNYGSVGPENMQGIRARRKVAETLRVLVRDGVCSVEDAMGCIRFDERSESEGESHG